MFRPPHSLLAALTLTTIVVTVALGWAGWRLLDQQRALDDQREWDRIESSADALAADVRSTLAETGERLSAWLADPAARPPRVEGAVVVTMSADQVLVTPDGALPFVPAVAMIPSTPTDPFIAIEAMEFGAGRLSAAADRYRGLTEHPDPQVRAGAWLRLARVLRKSGDLRCALIAYERLSALSAVRVDDVPAELVGLNGQRVVARALGDGERERDAGRPRAGGIEQRPMAPHPRRGGVLSRADGRNGTHRRLVACGCDRGGLGRAAARLAGERIGCARASRVHA